MTGEIRLRGYAALFNDWAWVKQDGVFECFAPGSFALHNSVDARVLHEGAPFAAVSRRTLTFFQDQHGLGFEAALPNDSAAWGLIPSMRHGWISVSVEMNGLGDHSTKLVDGVTYRTINHVSLNHIALAGDAVYQNTITWLSTWDPEDMPPVLSSAARRWAAGKDAAGVLLPVASTEPRPAAAITAPITARAAGRGPVPATIMRRLDALLREHRQCNSALLPPRPRPAK